MDAKPYESGGNSSGKIEDFSIDEKEWLQVYLQMGGKEKL